MCGRYHRKFTKQQMAEHFRAEYEDEYALEAGPSYNIGPQSNQPIVRLDKHGNRQIAVMRWGLVPFWSKAPETDYSTINARAERVATVPAFREPSRRRRALIPASGFFEWKRSDFENEQPYSFGVEGQDILAFASLWDYWHDHATGEYLYTFTIITTEPNELKVNAHDRMPVILDPAAYQRWLEPGDPTQPPLDLLGPFPADRMRRWMVSSEVGKARNNRPELIEPIKLLQPRLL